MDKLTIPLGKWFGIPVHVHWTLTLLLIFQVLTGGLKHAGFIALIFLCVLLHEFGHSLMAMRLKFKVRQIMLYFCGGCAEIQVNSQQLYKREFYIAVAGPLVSLALAVISYAAYSIYPVGIFQTLAIVNLALLIFNLIPAWPMDGGRIFRCVLMMITKNWRKSNNIAMNVAMVCSAGLIALGFFTMNINLIFISIMIMMISYAEGKKTGAFSKGGRWGSKPSYGNGKAREIEW